MYPHNQLFQKRKQAAFNLERERVRERERERERERLPKRETHRNSLGESHASNRIFRNSHFNRRGYCGTARVEADRRDSLQAGVTWSEREGRHGVHNNNAWSSMQFKQPNQVVFCGTLVSSRHHWKR